MHFNVSIMFDADNDDDAKTVIDSWQLTPGLTLTISSYSEAVTGTTDENGDLVESQPTRAA